MDEGSIFTVIIFPRPWPPPEKCRILSRDEDSTFITLIADPLGCLIFTVGSTNQDSRLFRFQPITIEGSGRASLIISWSKNKASIFLNGQNLSLEQDASGEIFTLKTSEAPIPQGLLLGHLNLSSTKSPDEYLLLSTLIDIDQKVIGGTRYDVIRAAALLRQLLLDRTPLVHVANRTYNAKIEFEVIDYRDPPPLSPQFHWHNLDSSYFPGAKTIILNLEGLLKAPCLELEGITATVHDLIRACANCKGGVHLGSARTSEENALIDWDRSITLIGEEPSLLAIAGLCRVVLKGLQPLVRDIVGSSQHSSPVDFA